MVIEKYQDLEIWKKAMNLCELVYRATEEFPRHEQYGLTSQLRRGAVSLPSNIAEGFIRRHGKEFKHFLSIVLSSLAELETQIILSLRLGYLVDEQVNLFLKETETLGKMTTKLYQRVNITRVPAY